MSSGGRNRTYDLLVQSQASLPTATAPESTSSGRRSRTFTACFKGRKPAISRSPKVPCGSRTHLSGLEGRHLCRSAKGTSAFSNCLRQAEGEGVEPSRLIARPRSKRLPSPIGLPSHVQHRR